MRPSRILLALGACAALSLLAWLGWVGESAAGEAAVAGEPEEEARAAAPVGELPDHQAPEETPAPEAPPAEVESAREEVTAPLPELPFLSQLEVLELAPPPEPELPIAGAISGRLLNERGPWTADELPASDTLVVELVRLEEPRLELRAQLRIEPLEGETEDGLALSYSFDEVPVGEYELSLFHLGSWHWEPATRVVRAPAEGMDFLRLDRDEVLPLEFQVFDGKSGEAIADFSAAHLEQTVSASSGVFMHAGPIDAESFPSASNFRWSVWAEGYRAAFGDERAFQFVPADEEGPERRVARVELWPGWSARLVVLGREPSMRPLERVRVRIDGRFVGATDHEGALVVELDAPPERIEADYRDWVLENDPLDPRPGTSPALRGHVTPLILKAPD